MTDTVKTESPIKTEYATLPPATPSSGLAPDILDRLARRGTPNQPAPTAFTEAIMARAARPPAAQGPGGGPRGDSTGRATDRATGVLRGAPDPNGVGARTTPFFPGSGVYRPPSFPPGGGFPPAPQAGAAPADGPYLLTALDGRLPNGRTYAATYSGAQPPADLGRLWVDTSQTPAVPRYWDGHEWADATGAQGPQGGQGVQGQPGPQGPGGAQGPQGQQGVRGQGFTLRGAWAAATAYVAFDVASYGGSVYGALAASTGVQPGTDAASWTLLASKGDQGVQGAAGPGGVQGVQGPAGAAGASGTNGTAATVSVGTTATLAAGAAATVTNGGTASAAVLNFGIPQGAAGQPVSVVTLAHFAASFPSAGNYTVAADFSVAGVFADIGFQPVLIPDRRGLVVAPDYALWALGVAAWTVYVPAGLAGYPPYSVTLAVTLVGRGWTGAASTGVAATWTGPTPVG